MHHVYPFCKLSISGAKQFREAKQKEVILVPVNSKNSLNKNYCKTINGKRMRFF